MNVKISLAHIILVVAIVQVMLPAVLQPLSAQELVQTMTYAPSSVDKSQLAAPNTLILYTAPNKDDTNPTDPMWGLRTMPEIAPFTDARFATTYERLGSSEGFTLLFFSARPQPSPDGRYLLVSGLEPRNDITEPGKSYLLLVDLWTGTQRQVLDEALLTTWNPTSDRFAYVTSGTLFVRSVAKDAEPKAIFTHEALNNGFTQWSPDGKWIAVTSFQQGEPATPNAYPPQLETVWLVPSAGGVAHQLATVPIAAIEHVPQELAWSSDSRYLSFLGYVLGVDGAAQELSDVGLVNRWLPNAPLLLVNRSIGLELLNPNGETVAHIADQGVILFNSAFAHDGQQLAYTQRSSDGDLQLWIYNIATRRNVPISVLPPETANGLSYMQWSADDSAILFDDNSRDSPIWAIPAQPESQPTVIIATGLLLKAVALPSEQLLTAAYLDGDPLTAVPSFDPTVYQTSTQTLASPDGRWLAEVDVALPNESSNNAPLDYYQQLTISRVDGSQRFAPLRLWSPFGLGWDAPQLERWSSDSKSLYFTVAGVTDGCGVFSSGSKLQRFNVVDNTITRVLFGDRWATFAPDEQHVAYLSSTGLVIQDLATREQQQADRQLTWPTLGGHLVWSPDGTHVAYTVANNPCMNGWTDSTTLVLVATATMTQTELLSNDKRRFVTSQWLDEEHLLVTDRESARYFSLDINSGAVTAMGEASVIAEHDNWTLRTNTELGGLTAQRSDGSPVWEVLPPGVAIGEISWRPGGATVVVEERNWHVDQQGLPAVVAEKPLRLWVINLESALGLNAQPIFIQSPPSYGASDGSGPMQVRFGSWSPNGQHLLFWSGPLGASIMADGLPVFVLNIQTGQVTPLADYALLNERYYSWSPDGTGLAITVGGGREAQSHKWLNLFDSATGAVTTVISQSAQIPGSVAWSPQGDWIAYAAIAAADATDDPLMTFDNPAIAARRIWLLDPRTGKRKRLNAVDDFQDAPVWSEDGTMLYYVQRQNSTVVLAATDMRTGKLTILEASRQPAPVTVGYYGQGDWAGMLAYRLRYSPQ
ncbi:MAG: hypothetical protein R3C14_28305 [Caldilineaceae bacterium]